MVEAAENLRRGIDSLPPPAPDEPEIVAKLREGFEGVERSFVGMLERNGIKRDDPTGSRSTPTCIRRWPSRNAPSIRQARCMQAWTPAWTLNGRLLQARHGRGRQGADQDGRGRDSAACSKRFGLMPLQALVRSGPD